ncbi:hypothetical protein AMAG_13891 [Allomyces macrogynus ATCC 38327]|uniref:Uncharacterized protein n=1 Tax=Allomyces macrogynus (strain ATCC 38327) TaxID=578462 RepID=A0A0L0T2U5_ALLM3|nr:hypothetical protein AMAG_13891 [Allomyces macrogynus ATCC 38327]|eukprot:KNE69017.1 hypothetical protein AMAG_13891 [Allomyces macrogynus ATCC 38327]
MPAAEDRDSYDDGAAGYDDDGASSDYGVDDGYGATSSWQGVPDDGTEAVGSREYITEIELALAESASGSSLDARAEAMADLIRAGRVHPLPTANPSSMTAALDGVVTPPDSALPHSPSQTDSTTSADRAFEHHLLQTLYPDSVAAPPPPWHMPRHASAPWPAVTLTTSWRARAATADTPSSPSTATGGSFSSLARDLDLLSRAWRASASRGAMGLDSRSSSGSDLAIDPVTGRAEIASRVMPATPHLRAHAVPSPPPLRVRRGLRRSETSGSMCSEGSSSIPDGRRSRTGMLAAARVMNEPVLTSATSSSASLSITLPAAATSPVQVRTGSESGAIAALWIASWMELPAAHARRERFRLLGCRPGAVGENDSEVGVHTRHVLASAGAKRPAQWSAAIVGEEGSCRSGAWYV